MKNKILPICLQGNYRDSLGEFIKTSDGMVEAERVRGGMFYIWFWYFPDSKEGYFLQTRKTQSEFLE